MRTSVLNILLRLSLCQDMCTHLGIPKALERVVALILRFDLPWMIWRLLPASLRLLCYRKLEIQGHRVPFSTITTLPFGLLLKKTAHNPYAEAENTRFIARNTSIPVPRILDIVRCTTYGSEQGGLILMNRIDGEPLGEWVVSRVRHVPDAVALIARLEHCLETNDIGSIPEIDRKSVG